MQRRAYDKPAAGRGAVWSTLRYAARTSGLARGIKSLLVLNQERGFDCPGSAWPDPMSRSVAELCENGARRAPRGRSAEGRRGLLRGELDDGQLPMMTIRSRDRFNTTVYELDDRYRGVFGERRVVLMNAEDMAERGLSEGAEVDVKSHYRGTNREVRGFFALACDIPRGCVATYFPEASPLVPLEHHADESRTPASKSVVVTLHASAV
jgi:anaerobic selenocysteine-containing dehydrogenase